MIRKKYSLDVFVMETLVQEAIDFAAQNANAIEAPPKEESKDADEADEELSDMAMSEDEDQEFNLMEEFR